MSEEITIKKDELDKLINERLAEIMNQKPKVEAKIEPKKEIDIADLQIELNKKQKEDSAKEFERASLISKFETLKKTHKNDETSFIFETIDKMKGGEQFYDSINGLEASLLKIAMEKEADNVIKNLYFLGKIRSFEELEFERNREKEAQEKLAKANSRNFINEKIVDVSKLNNFEKVALYFKEKYQKPKKIG